MKFQDIKTVDELIKFAENSRNRTYYEVDRMYPFTVHKIEEPNLMFNVSQTNRQFMWGDGRRYNDFTTSNALLYDNIDEATKYSKDMTIAYYEKELARLKDENK